MIKQCAFLSVCLFLGGMNVSAQEEGEVTEWTLRSCLDYALANNIQIKKSKVSLQSEVVSLVDGISDTGIRELPVEWRGR